MRGRALRYGAVCILVGLILSLASWADGRLRVEAIIRADCLHCQAEKTFLQALQRERPELVIRLYDIATPEGTELFKAVTQAYRLPLSLPITVVAGSILQGFDSAATTGEQIRRLLAAADTAAAGGFAELLATTGAPIHPDLTDSRQPLQINLPLVGTLDVTAWSLPALAMVLGFLDGFNPCAMWVLVAFLLILLQMGSRRRMWIVAGLFIVAETVMYYLILNLWYRVWDFIGLDRIITPLVGLVAVGGSLFFLYQSWKTWGSALACRVMNLEQHNLMVQRIRRLAAGPFTLLAALSIIGLAFSVNVVEFACSIGYPQTFTKIIELNQPGFWLTQWYMGLYVLFYMADDFAVFALALWSFEQVHALQRYSRWTTLVGGILLLILGGLLLFQPEWLLFGK